MRLRGVNTASLEWSSNGEGRILATVKTAIDDWHVNIIRLPLAQDRWFGKAPEQTDQGVAYQALVKQAVDTCGRRLLYRPGFTLVGCPRVGKQIGQHAMPDRNSLVGFPLGEAHPPSVDCEAIGRFGRKKRLVDAETQEHNL